MNPRQYAFHPLLIAIEEDDSSSDSASKEMQTTENSKKVAKILQRIRNARVTCILHLNKGKETDKSFETGRQKGWETTE